jgi:hypothetical protein
VEFVEKMIFQNFSRGKLQFFPTFLGGKFSAEFSLEKTYEKSAPGLKADSVLLAGESDLTKSAWDEARSLENRRRARLERPGRIL